MNKLIARILGFLAMICVAVALLPQTAARAYADCATQVNVYDEDGNLLGKLDSKTKYVQYGRLVKNAEFGLDGCTAYFDAGSGTLWLVDYSGGPIEVPDDSDHETLHDLTIVLEGSSVITNTGKNDSVLFGVKCDPGVLTIDSTANGSLVVNVTTQTDGAGKVTTYGIESEKSEHANGGFTLKGNADLTINLKNESGSNKSNVYGVYSDGVLQILDSASINVKTETDGFYNMVIGLYSDCLSNVKEGLIIDTAGNVTVDLRSVVNATSATPVRWYGAFVEENSLALKRVNTMILVCRSYDDVKPGFTYNDKKIGKWTVKEGPRVYTIYRHADFPETDVDVWGHYRTAVTEINAEVDHDKYYMYGTVGWPKFTVAEDALYEFDNNNVKWERKEGDKWVSVKMQGSFQRGTYRYTVPVRIKDTSDYRFPFFYETPDRPTVKVNGVKWQVLDVNVMGTYLDCWITVRSPEYVIEDNPVSNISIQGKLPALEAGEPLPATSEIKTSDSAYEILDAYWIREKDQSIHRDDGATVARNEDYRLVGVFIPKTGYVFTETEDGITYYDGDHNKIYAGPMTTYTGTLGWTDRDHYGETLPHMCIDCHVGGYKIKHVSIDSLTLPYDKESGSNANGKVFVVDEKRYEILSQGWYAKSNGESPVNTFVRGKTYYYRVHLQAKQGYEFPSAADAGNLSAEELPVFINGDSECVTERYRDADGTIWITGAFKAEGWVIEYFGDLEICNLKKPKVGEVVTAASVPANVNYELAGEMWVKYSLDGKPQSICDPGTEFEAGCLYYYIGFLRPVSPYVLVTDEEMYKGKIKVNGEIAQAIDSEYLASISGDDEKELEYNCAAYHYECIPVDDGQIMVSRWFRTRESRFDDRLVIAKKSLTLYDTIAIDFKVPAAVAEWYEDPFLLVTQDGEESENRNYTVSSDGEYLVFSVRVAPHVMGDVIQVVPCAYDSDRKVVEGRSMEYSVADYCKNMLGNENYQSDEWADFRRLLVDILYYGDAAQIYANYRTDRLVSAFLSDEQRSMGTDVNTAVECNSIKDKDFRNANATNGLASIESAALYLEAAVNVQFKVMARDTTGLRVVITDDEDGQNVIGAAPVKASNVDENGRYVVRFAVLNAGQMRKPIYATVIKGGNKVSNTYRYSIESYVASMRGREIANLDNLLNAMMRYGDSAALFAKSVK
ncbi:MAG: hypothetical protein IK081_02150 [Lachnospiraceae bacterium]|nr:hypothetical protein [Lachnospiraceae bacterium]